MAMSRIKAIQTFFGLGEGARPVGNQEIMALGKETRMEIGDACLSALGETLELAGAATA